MNSLEEVNTYLETLIPRSRSFDDRLTHVKAILKKLGNPQNAIPAIHIAGTSGKGSTAYYAAAMLREAGYTVGLMVSPHVSKVSERAQINGTPLPDDIFCAYITEFRQDMEKLREEATYIEFLTCFAFWLFAKQKVDYSVIEVGLGGRLDATNTITRRDTVRVITDIGFDHTEILGITLDAIAREKAGIVHDGDTVCMHPQDSLVMKSVQEAVSAHRAQLVLVDDIDKDAPIGYQGRNWTLARQAVTSRLMLDKKSLLNDALYTRTAHLSIPGRFEVFSNEDETIVLDGAHNPQKMAAFLNALQTAYKEHLIIAVISLGKNKKATVADTVKFVEANVNEVVVTEFQLDGDDTHGALSATDIKGFIKDIPASIEQDPCVALNEARKKAKATRAIVVVTGSFYLVSNVREKLMTEFGKTK